MQPQCTNHSYKSMQTSSTDSTDQVAQYYHYVLDMKLSICYTMPTRGVSRIHEAITINPEGGLMVIAECTHDTTQVGMV